ncbi:Hydrocephalus-inducing protein [Balamuthia mandrillaris]
MKSTGCTRRAGGGGAGAEGKRRTSRRSSVVAAELQQQYDTVPTRNLDDDAHPLSSPISTTAELKTMRTIVEDPASAPVFVEGEALQPGLQRLVVVEQQSLHKENFSKNGEMKNVHNVVKNTPFFIELALAKAALYDDGCNFRSMTLEAGLFFDCEGEKEVPFLSGKPLEYKGHINDAGDRMKLELKIKVLSSHCENMLFKIRFQLVPPVGSNVNGSLWTTFSEPIKVISKPDQLFKKKGKKTGVSHSGADASHPVGAAVVATTTPKRKRTVNDRIEETVLKMFDQQQEQTQLLHTIIQQLAEEQRESCTKAAILKNKQKEEDPDQPPFGELLVKVYHELLSARTAATHYYPHHPPASTSTPPTIINDPHHDILVEEEELQMGTGASTTTTNGGEVASTTTTIAATRGGGVSGGEDSLEKAFHALLDAFERTDADERPLKVRKIMRGCPSRKMSLLGEMVALFNSEGLASELRARDMGGDADDYDDEHTRGATEGMDEGEKLFSFESFLEDSEQATFESFAQFLTPAATGSGDACSSASAGEAPIAAFGGGRGGVGRLHSSRIQQQQQSSTVAGQQQPFILDDYLSDLMVEP